MTLGNCEDSLPDQGKAPPPTQAELQRSPFPQRFPGDLLLLYLYLPQDVRQLQPTLLLLALLQKAVLQIRHPKAVVCHCR